VAATNRINEKGTPVGAEKLSRLIVFLLKAQVTTKWLRQGTHIFSLPFSPERPR
jgi:hypothetical protein